MEEKYILKWMHLPLILIDVDFHLYWVRFSVRLHNSLRVSCFTTPVYKGFDNYEMLETCATEWGNYRKVFRAGKQGSCTEDDSSTMLSIFSNSQFFFFYISKCHLILQGCFLILLETDSLQGLFKGSVNN